jgi:hypothetical protein
VADASDERLHNRSSLALNVSRLDSRTNCWTLALNPQLAWLGRYLDRGYSYKTYHTPTIFTNDAENGGSPPASCPVWPEAEGFHSGVMVGPSTTLQPADVLSICPGSGIPSVSCQADLTYGSGCAMMHMDVQQDQKHRRSSSAWSEDGDDFVQRPLLP